MPFGLQQPPSLVLKIMTAIAGVVVIGSGLKITYNYLTPTGVTFKEIMQEWKTGSGAGIWFGKTGGITASGALATKNLSAAACTNATTSKLLTTGTGMLICGVDADTNTTYGAGQGLNLTSTTFRTADNLTGSTMRALTSLASSGSFAWETTASGAEIWTSRISGMGLASCNTAGQVLQYNSTSKQFECSSIAASGSGANLVVNNIFSQAGTFTLNSASFADINAALNGTVTVGVDDLLMINLTMMLENITTATKLDFRVNGGRIGRINDPTYGSVNGLTTAGTTADNVPRPISITQFHRVQTGGTLTVAPQYLGVAEITGGYPSYFQVTVVK